MKIYYAADADAEQYQPTHWAVADIITEMNGEIVYQPCELVTADGVIAELSSLQPELVEDLIRCRELGKNTLILIAQDSATTLPPELQGFGSFPADQDTQYGTREIVQSAVRTFLTTIENATTKLPVA